MFAASTWRIDFHAQISPALGERGCEAGAAIFSQIAANRLGRTGVFFLIKISFKQCFFFFLPFFFFSSPLLFLVDGRCFNSQFVAVG